MSYCDQLYHRTADVTIDIKGELVSMKCRAVLFDMDGTLVDSTQAVELAWRWWVARHNISLEDVLSFSHGRRPSLLLSTSCPGKTIPRTWMGFRISKRHRPKEYWRCREARKFVYASETELPLGDRDLLCRPSYVLRQNGAGRIRFGFSLNPPSRHRPPFARCAVGVEFRDCYETLYLDRCGHA